jgi:hypothetical protein
MRVPQVSERVKEAPAHALRAVFAGIGQVLLVADRMRNRPQDTRPAGPASPPEDRAPAASEAVTAAPVANAPAGAAPAKAAPAKAAPAKAAPAPAPPAPAVPPAPDEAAGPLPLPNYDELTVASLRARMRVLNPAQLRALIDYENSHSARADVVSMFERRIAKIEAGGSGLAG